MNNPLTHGDVSGHRYCKAALFVADGEAEVVGFPTSQICNVTWVLLSRTQSLEASIDGCCQGKVCCPMSCIPGHNGGTVRVTVDLYFYSSRQAWSWGNNTGNVNERTQKDDWQRNWLSHHLMWGSPLCCQSCCTFLLEPWPRRCTLCRRSALRRYTGCSRWHRKCSGRFGCQGRRRNPQRGHSAARTQLKSGVHTSHLPEHCWVDMVLSEEITRTFKHKGEIYRVTIVQNEKSPPF